MRQAYSYTAAENFRLVSMKAGTSPTYDNRQNISYTYDDAGNVLTITDAAAYGGSQAQKFTYDGLDRLYTACTLSGANCVTADGSYGSYSQRSYAYDNAGNLISWSGVEFAYRNAAHKHALTHISSVQKYWYDANGNATRRISGSQDITLTYDAENRLTAMSGGVTSSYVYNADGMRVKETAGGATTVYVGNYFEWTGSTATMKSYYDAGAVRVAMRTGVSTGTVNYLLGDHLSSQALTLTSAGARLNTNTELRYYPWGGGRYVAGATPTSYNFTGQRKDSGSGLLFYNARWYDPVIGRFISADTIVPQPGNPQSLNRYSYALNNAVRFTDPTGHFTADEICTYFANCGADKDQWKTIAQAALGSLFDLLWETPITWGDMLFMGNEQGATSAAIFVLMTDNDDGSSAYYAGLWVLSGQGADMPRSWQSAQQAATLAAYSVSGNSWEGMARRQAETWVGDDWMQTLPAINGIWSLHKRPESANYHFSTYMDYNGWWWAAAGITVAAWAPGGLARIVGIGMARLIGGGALVVDAAGLAGDVFGWEVLAGPVDAAYPAVYDDPQQIGRAPYQLHVTGPRGVQP
ncbi:RHS repeat-associated core domain-containing protein [Candidatus Amarolinea aalborgensis]|uniref:RHS repeat-associated core domain-containing protein n=1 Tax=Candidatus Amarolinea aalborgensis TaxID=2249329 RepID=UPI003BFA0BBF